MALLDNLIIILVLAAALLGHLGPARRLGHDDLVHTQHCRRGIRGKLESPKLKVSGRRQEVITLQGNRSQMALS